MDVDVDIDGDGDLAVLDEDPGYLSDAAHSSKHARLSRASSAASQRRERPKSRKERTPVYFYDYCKEAFLAWLFFRVCQPRSKLTFFPTLLDPE